MSYKVFMGLSNDTQDRVGRVTFQLIDIEAILSLEIVFLAYRVENLDEKNPEEGLLARLDLISEVRVEAYLRVLRYKKNDN